MLKISPSDEQPNRPTGLQRPDLCRCGHELRTHEHFSDRDDCVTFGCACQHFRRRRWWHS